MSAFVWRSGITYSDYLQAKSLLGDVTAEVSAQSRALVASHKQLEHAGITLRETIRNEAGAQIEVFRYGLDQTTNAIRELDATFRWECAELLAVAGRMSDTLKELLRISKTPAQNWACEQYEIARDAVRRHHYPEALEAVERAINGFGGQTGYRLDYRFHLLLGTIRLGNIRNTSTDVLSLPYATRAFLDAAKYARVDYPAEAARSFLAAGHSAYCQGNIEDARRWTAEAIALNAQLPEAHFQQGKLNAHVGDGPAAMHDLKNAVLLEPLYAVRALDDGDYQSHSNEVTALLTQLHDQARAAVQLPLAKAMREYGELRELSFGGHAFPERPSKDSAGDCLGKASEAFERDNYKDYLECADWLRDAMPKLSSERQQFLQGIERVLSHGVWECQSRLKAIRTTKLSHDARALRKWGTMGIPVMTILVGYSFGTVEGCGTIAFLFFLFVAPILFFLGITFGERIHKWPESQALKLEMVRLKQLQREFPTFRDSVNARALSQP